MILVLRVVEMAMLKDEARSAQTIGHQGPRPSHEHAVVWGYEQGTVQPPECLVAIVDSYTCNRERCTCNLTEHVIQRQFKMGP